MSWLEWKGEREKGCLFERIGRALNIFCFAWKGSNLFEGGNFHFAWKGPDTYNAKELGKWYRFN